MAIRKRKSEKFAKFVGKSNSDFQSYKNGAIIGGLLGGVTGLLINKSVLWCMLIGAVAGGYVNYQVSKGDDSIPSLRNFSMGKDLTKHTNESTTF